MSGDNQDGVIPAQGTPDWRVNKRGDFDTDLYSESVGYDDDAEVTWWEGRNVGGVTIGLLQFRGNFFNNFEILNKSNIFLNILLCKNN